MIAKSIRVKEEQRRESIRVLMKDLEEKMKADGKWDEVRLRQSYCCILLLTLNLEFKEGGRAGNQLL